MDTQRRSFPPTQSEMRYSLPLALLSVVVAAWGSPVTVNAEDAGAATAVVAELPRKLLTFEREAHL